MSYHSELMADATELQFDVQADANRVRLTSPKAVESWPVRAIVGLIEVSQETFEHGNTMKTKAVETCRVLVEAAKFAQQPPNDSWRASVDGSSWPIDRVSGIGTSFLTLHLKRRAQKRAGVRHDD